MRWKNSIISFSFLALLVISTSVMAGGEFTFIDDYKISTKEDFEPNKLYAQSWEITYGESKRPVQILLKETRRGDEYLIRTKYFEVKYINTNKGFGVKAMKASDLIVPEALNNQVINQKEMETQEIISMSVVSREKALKLIASYLPDLVNDQYKNILN